MSVPRPGHVGRDRDGAALAGARDDLGLLLVELGVEHGVDDARALQHARQHLGRLDAHGAHEHGLAALVGLLDLADHGVELVAAGLENGVVPVDADAGLVGRDDLHREPVDVVELGRLGLRRAGHAGELLVHAEIILDRDRRVGARLALDRDVFLRLDRLVQAVGPAAAGHDAAGVFVDDHHLALLHDVFDVAFVERIGAQQLGNGVDVLGDLGVARLRGEFLLLALLGRERRVLVEIAELGGEVGQHERVGIVRPQLGAADLGEVGLVLALVDDEERAPP